MGWFKRATDKKRRAIAHGLPDAIRQRLAASPAYGRAIKAEADGDHEKAERFRKLSLKYLLGKGRVPRYDRSGWE